MSDDHRAVPVLEFEDAGLGFGPRRLWSGLSLRVEAGEFIAVLGANGSGKTSLVRAILGLQRLSAGRLRVSGRPPRRGANDIGYVPQQRRIDPLTPLRARDVVGQGLDGHRWGLGRHPGRDARVTAALDSVDAASFAHMPVGLLSGGEQQRIRVAQALVADPRLLLCDEPLLSLDLRSQQTTTALVDRRRREKGTAVVFVTHEINPVLPYVDRVLYLADGGFRSGTVQEVFTSATLSDLYGVPIEVLRVNGRILVAGIPPADESHHHHEGAEVGAEHV
ncbi:ABC transporter ATP-binding protein [Micromonospora sp. WMMD975]|uniref:metal ABC transporter ATP-binding protein n=1 Tax=Micromonospora sp. WMMD975 TaxID=3016087 RepID=UPI00249C4D71|nr:ABC transporter ATP-binding protein [Micromonospora sp. WMMD975]WFE30970.1 ABC transporter ATP-binding protein [Micromonospora sp. WMMD975]